MIKDPKPIKVEVTKVAAPSDTSSGSTSNSSTNGLAIAALVVGIVALLCSFVPVLGFVLGVVAVVLGVVAMKNSGNNSNSKGMAIGGIVTGGMGLLAGLFITVVFAIGMISLGAGTGTIGLNAVEKGLSEADKESQAMLDAKKDFAKGETGKFGKFEVKINSVKRDYVPENLYMAADDGKEYIVLSLTIKNVSDETEYVSSYDYDVSDNGLAVGTASASIDGELDSGDLSPGASTTGNLVYEVTKGATDLKLQSTETVYLFNEGETREVVYTLAF